MEKEHAHSKEKRKDFAFGISLKEWIIAIALGLGSGLITASKTIRDQFHKDVVNSTDFAAHFSKRQEKLDTLHAQNFETKWDYWKAISEEKRRLASEYDDLAWEFRKVRKAPIFGTIDRFHGLSPRSKGSIYFSTLFGAAIGGAMALSFFNGVATRDKIERIEDAVTRPEASR